MFAESGRGGVEHDCSMDRLFSQGKEHVSDLNGVSVCATL